MSTHPTPRPMDFDGLVVEDATGSRLLSLPAAILQDLRQATVIRYRRGDSLYSMRVADFADGRTGGHPTTQAHDEPAPTASPSPTTPPPVEDDQDPANIPLRARRGGQWTTIYVTRAQYEQYVEQGRIAPHAPDTDEGAEQ